MAKTGKVICPYCGTGCQVELHVENNVIRSALGVHDNPVNQGNLCLKGFYGWDYVGAPDRLTKPLIRKKDGVFSYGLRRIIFNRLFYIFKTLGVFLNEFVIYQILIDNSMD